MQCKIFSLRWKFISEIAAGMRQMARDHSFSTYAKFSKKIKQFYPLKRTRTCAYQWVGNVNFIKDFAYVLNGWNLMEMKVYSPTNAYSEPSQNPKIELFAIIVNCSIIICNWFINPNLGRLFGGLILRCRGGGGWNYPQPLYLISLWLS